ncbi:MAG: uL22 family ribosomal protein [archaeon]
MTEKDYNPEQKQAKAMKKQQKAEKKKENIAEAKTEKVEEKKTEKKDKENKEVKDETKKEEKPEKKITKPKRKKTEAVVNARSLPISTKQAIAVCKFVKGKTIENAMNDLEKVVRKKIAVPMKGEIPHRKGKIMSGRFPRKTSEHFLKLLKSLAGNANVNEINEPIIFEAIANIAPRPYGKFGAVRKKRTHIKLVAKEKKVKNKSGEKK